MRYKSVNRKLEIITAIMAVVLLALLVFQNTPAQNYKNRLSLGNRFLKAENYERAEALFNEAIEIAPKKADPYIGLAAVYTNQADDILARYQAESGQEEMSDVISAKEKERMEELYQKAQGALDQALQLDQDSAEIEEYISYLTQQQESAEDLRADEERKNAEENEDSNQPQNLQNMVDLNGGSTTLLEENTVYTSFDLDGDGSIESIEVRTQKGNLGYGMDTETSSQLIIDGRIAVEFSGMENGVSGTCVTVHQMNTGDIYLSAYLLCVDDGDVLEEALYQYRNGALEKLFDLTPVDDTGESFHDTVGDFVTEGNTIRFSVGMQPSAVGLINMSRALICVNGTVDFLGNEAEVTYYPYYPSLAEDGSGEDPDPEYYPLRIDIPCYETGDSQEVSSILAAGTMCKVTKAYFENGMHIKRFYLETEDGRTGWFDQNLSVRNEYGANQTVFYGHGFAG